MQAHEVLDCVRLRISTDAISKGQVHNLVNVTISELYALHLFEGALFAHLRFGTLELTFDFKELKKKEKEWSIPRCPYQRLKFNLHRYARRFLPYLGSARES